MCAYLLFPNVCFWYLMHSVCCDGTLRNPGQVLFSCHLRLHLRSRSLISNVRIQGMNQMMWSSKIFHRVYPRIKVFYDEMRSFPSLFVVGEKASGLSFSPIVRNIFWMNQSVSGLTNATWFGFICSAARPHCPSGLAVWLIQCATSLICICLCKCQL